MFGWGKKDVDGLELNSRNPFLAIVFHPLFDDYCERLPGDEYLFKLPLIRQFEKDYKAASLARRHKTFEQLRRELLKTSVDLLSPYANDQGKNEHLGRGAALTTIGRIIFAIAPGLATEGPSEAEETAKLIIRDLGVAFDRAAPQTYLSGVSRTCFEFLDFFNEVRGNREENVKPLRGADVLTTVIVSQRTARYGGPARAILATGKSYEVQVPANVADGTQLRLRGLGRHGTNGSEPGDAIVSIKIDLNEAQQDQRKTKEAARSAFTGRNHQPQNKAIPIGFIQSLAEQGNAEAQFLLGTYYNDGLEGLRKDEREAANLFKLAAAQGDASARFMLGVFHSQGLGGLRPDDREAVRFWKLAAEQGLDRAQYNLGQFFNQGRGGLPQDDREAVRFWKLAAEQGNAGGQCGLGLFYEQGRGGLARDEREAVRLFKLAAAQGETHAESNLGTCYAEGRGGLRRDDCEAVRLWKLAADKGHDTAQCNLGGCYSQGAGGLSKNDREAVQFWKLSAEQGNAGAQCNLGQYYAEGLGGLAKDDREAVRLFKLAADQAHGTALFNLAKCYSQGLGGLHEDMNEALRLIRLAAKQGHDGAQRILASSGIAE